MSDNINELRTDRRNHRGGKSFMSVAEIAEDTGYHPNSVRRKARDPNDPFPPLVRLGPNKAGMDRETYEDWKRSLIEAASLKPGAAA